MRIGALALTYSHLHQRALAPEETVLAFSCRLPTIRIARNACDVFETSLNVGFRSSPGRNADAHSGLPLPDCPSAPAGTVLLHAADDLARSFGTTERHENLIDDHIVENVESGAA